MVTCACRSSRWGSAPSRPRITLIAVGVRPGDRVAIWAPNVWQWVVAALGVSAAGGVLVPINTRFKADEAQYIIDKSGAQLVLTVGEFLGVDYQAMCDGTLLDDFLAHDGAAGRPPRRPARRSVRRHLHLGHDRQAQRRDGHARADHRVFADVERDHGSARRRPVSRSSTRSSTRSDTRPASWPPSCAAPRSIPHAVFEPAQRDGAGRGRADHDAARAARAAPADPRSPRPRRTTTSRHCGSARPAPRSSLSR